MNGSQLWAALSVEDDTYHRLQWLADWTGVEGMTMFNERVPFTGERWGEAYVPVGARARFEHLVTLDDCRVSFVPRRKEEERTLGNSGVMWVRLDAAKQMKRLQGFQPIPSLVLREGTSVRRVAMWFVDPRPNVAQLERGNRRLAHALGCRKKYADPLQLFHPPGVTLRWGREKRSLVVEVEHFNGAVYTPGQVAGRLRDAPDAWTPEVQAA